MKFGRMKKDSRGFRRLDFEDIYGEKCSIEESSLATKSAIWLGQDTGTHHASGTCLARMHLDIPLARRLRRLLDRFIRQGTLQAPPPRRPCRVCGGSTHMSALERRLCPTCWNGGWRINEKGRPCLA